MCDTGWVLGVFLQIDEAQCFCWWMIQLCLRACSRLRMSGWEYSHSAKVWSSAGTTEPRTHFEECHGWIHFGTSSDALPLGFKMVSHILPKLDCVVATFLCWWRSLQKAYWACYILHICAIHCWEMAGAVPNCSFLSGNVRASLCLLSLSPTYLKKEENSLVPNLS